MKKQTQSDLALPKLKKRYQRQIKVLERAGMENVTTERQAKNGTLKFWCKEVNSYFSMHLGSGWVRRYMYNIYYNEILCHSNPYRYDAYPLNTRQKVCKFGRTTRPYNLTFNADEQAMLILNCYFNLV